MVKKVGACALGVLYFVFSTYNSYYAYAEEMNFESEGKEIVLEVIDCENQSETLHYNSDRVFSDSYRTDLSDCKGMKTDYDNFEVMDADVVNEILENGTVIVVDVDNQKEINYVDSKYNDVKVCVEAEMENMDSVYLSENGGEVIMGFIGSAAAEGENTKSENKGERQENLENILDTIEREEVFAVETKLNELEVENKEGDGLEFQIPSLKTAIQPITAICRLYTEGYIEYLGDTSVTLYCYRGSVWNNGSKKTYYNYILSSAYVSPINDTGVVEYSVEIGSNNVYTSIVEAAFLDDKEKSSTYSLSAGMGVAGGSNGGTLNVNYNNSISNTYSTSSMNVIERFSQMHAGGVKAYCEWYVKPEDPVEGQSRKIEPAIVTKSTGLTNCRTSVDNIVLKKDKIFNAPYSGKVIELKAVFK